MSLTRDKIKNTTGSPSKLKLIAEHDAKITLPIIIEIFRDIKKIAEQDVLSEISQPVKEKFEITQLEVLFNQSRVEIKSFFEEFLNSVKSIDEIETRLSAKFDEIVTLILGYLDNDKGLTNSQKLSSNLKSYAYISLVLATYTEIDSQQRVGVAQLLSKFASYTELAIRRPFALLCCGAEYIYLSNHSLPLLNEAALWLEGMYLNIKNRMLKNKKGEIVLGSDNKYPTINWDLEDKAFKAAKGLCKYDIALYYQNLSLLINTKTKAYSSEGVTANASVDVGKFEEGNQTFKIVIKAGEIHVTGIPQDKQGHLEYVAQYIKSALTSGRTALNHTEFKEVLSVGVEDRERNYIDELRIIKLQQCLTKYNLTVLQNESLAYLDQEITATLAQYKSDTGIGLWARAHTTWLMNIWSKFQ